MAKTPDFKQNKDFSDFFRKKNNPLPETGWNYVGPSEEHGINFLSGWGNSSSTSVPASWYLSDDGQVKLRGRVIGGDVGTTIFTLPEEVRPEFEEKFIIAIEDDVHLENIHFRAFLDGTGIPDGIFLAGGIGDDNVDFVYRKIISSGDGNTWGISHNPWDDDEGYHSVFSFAKSPSLYVAAANARSYSGTTSRIITSPDVFTWTEQVTPWDDGNNAQPTSVTYASAWNTFYAVGVDGGEDINTQIKSTDGVTWINDDTNPFQTNFNWYIFYSPIHNKLFSCGYGGGYGNPAIIYSTEDGITWTAVVTPIDGTEEALGVGGYAITENGRIFFAGQDDEQLLHVIYTDDGVNWFDSGFTPITIVPFDDPGLGTNFSYGIAYAKNPRIIAIGGSSGGANVYISSDNGDTWTGVDADLQIESMAASPSKFVAGGNSFGRSSGMITSTDGTTWIPIVSSPWSGEGPDVEAISYFAN